MKSDEEKLEELLNAGPFKDLSVAEKEFVVGILGSEERFDSLQKIEAGLRRYSTDQAPLPAPRVLSSLAERMRQSEKERSWMVALFQFKVPAYAVLSLLVVASTLAAMLSRRTSGLQLVEVPKLRVDTVYTTRTDTVYREKLVMRYVPVPPPAGIKPTPSTPDLVMGVSMKDKEELDKLLVGVN